MHILKIIGVTLFFLAFAGSLVTSTKYISVGLPILGFISFFIAVVITTEPEDGLREFLGK